MLSASSENYLKGSEAVTILQVAKEHLMFFLQHILINLSFNFSSHTQLMVAILDSTALSVKFALNDCIRLPGPSGCCHCPSVFLSAHTPQPCDKGSQDSFYLKNPTAGFEAADCAGWSGDQEDRSGRLSKVGGRGARRQQSWPRGARVKSRRGWG